MAPTSPVGGLSAAAQSGGGASSSSSSSSSFWSSKLGMAVAAGAAVGGCVVLYKLLRGGSKPSGDGASADASPASPAGKRSYANVAASPSPAAAAASSAGENGATAHNGGAAPRKANDLKTAGNEQFKKKNWAEAEQLYTDAVAAAGASGDKMLTAQCYCNRAAARYMQDNLDGASGDCTEALAIEPKYFKAIKRRADVEEKAGNLRACVRDLFAAIRSCDAGAENPPGLKGGRKQHESAMRDFDRVLSLLGKKLAEEEVERRSPRTPAPCLIDAFIVGYGDLLDESKSVKKLTSEINALGLAGAATVEAGVLHRRRALAKIKAKRYDDVLGDADEAVRILREAAAAGNEDRAELCEALSLQGDWLMYNGVPKQAKAALDEALALQPDHTHSIVRRGLVLNQLQDVKGGVAELERAREHDPRNPVVLYFLAQMVVQAAAAEVPVNALGQPVNPSDERLANAVRRAEALYSECLELGFDTAMVHINLAQVRAQQGNASGAKESIEAAERGWPDSPIVHIFKGQHALNPANPSEAFKCWDRAAELDPKSPLPALQRANVLLQDQRTMMQGMQTLRECVKIEPRFDPAHQLLGQLCMQVQDFKAAIEHFNASIAYAREFRDLALAFGFKEVCIMRSEKP